jgi:serine protease Do
MRGAAACDDSGGMVQIAGSSRALLSARLVFTLNRISFIAVPLALALVLFCSPITHLVEAATPAEIARNTFPSVVLIKVFGAQGTLISVGSGFFVREDLIATNAHVIERASRVVVKIVGQAATYEAIGTTAVDKTRDLALLKIASVKGTPLRFGDADSVAVGEEVFAVGNPAGFEGTFSQGLISGIRIVDGRRMLQMTAAVSPGSSGGPLLNRRGEVVGIVSEFFRKGQSLNFAIPASVLTTLLATKGSVSSFAVPAHVPDAIKERGNKGKAPLPPKSGEWRAEASRSRAAQLRAARDYKASLDRLLVLREDDVARAIEQRERTRELVDRGVVSRNDLDTRERALADARARLDQTWKEAVVAASLIARALAYEECVANATESACAE